MNKLLPTGGNALLTAQFKTGKTTLVNQLTRSVADGRPFLGRYETPAGRVALFNYEVDGSQYRRWLREVGIQNTDNVVVLNLRGYRLPVTTPHIEDWVVKFLNQHEINMWIVDPFARAFTGSGTSENDNTEVGRFLDTLDVIKARAGVSELVLPTHTGRGEFEQGQERARGATRLDDWADVRWFLTKDEADVRYFSATGRDVEVGEAKLDYDEATRGYEIGGGDRNWERNRRVEQQIVTLVTDRPGLNATEIRNAVTGNTSAVSFVLAGLVSRGDIVVVEAGKAKHHYPRGHVMLAVKSA